LNRFGGKCFSAAADIVGFLHHAESAPPRVHFVKSCSVIETCGEEHIIADCGAPFWLNKEIVSTTPAALRMSDCAKTFGEDLS
jgi:hypothetical protein